MDAAPDSPSPQPPAPASGRAAKYFFVSLWLFAVACVAVWVQWEGGDRADLLGSQFFGLSLVALLLTGVNLCAAALAWLVLGIARRGRQARPETDAPGQA